MILKPDAICPGAILIADDHQIFRDGLCRVLQGALAPSDVLQAENFEQTLEHLGNRGIALAIIDLGMPGLSSPRDLTKIRRARPEVLVIVLSGSDRREDILAALEAGVHGYIVKSTRTKDLLAQVGRVLDGEIYVPAVLADLPQVNDHAGCEVQPRDSVLTARQQDVLRLIIDGLPNKAIGKALDVSEGTVKMHVAAILRATGASNRAHAAAIGKKYL
ncbi:MAG: response regulator transcription factor [Alphaproteobacteria bacterium]|nr:response regulator transcription factor [Alphaproteobacteria bacterium]